MSADAINDLTVAMRVRLEQAITGKVQIGPPSADDGGERAASLFLFHIEPNREMRNSTRLVDEGAGIGPLSSHDATPLDLRYLISAFRTDGAADPDELKTLGRIIKTLADNPTFGNTVLADQEVRVTLEPYPMEEISRVWGLFPTTPYQPSAVYLASPVFITSGPTAAGPPVTEWTQRAGQAIGVT
jgi:hypothetical protein